MSLWSDRLLPHVIDKACGMAELEPFRREALAGLRGRVLDVGFGSGTNLPLLPATVTEVVAVEPSDVAWRMSEGRRTTATVPVTRGGLDGESLALDDASVDAAAITFALCTIPDPVRALLEVRRVLRAGGAVHFLEHGLSPVAGVATWQHRIDPVQRRLFGGCHLSRDIPSLVREAGLEVVDLREDELPGPRFLAPWSHAYLGRAVPS